MGGGETSGGRADRGPAFPVGRLAPSPTGALHIGNARTFLIAWLSVRSRGGACLLRIEDLDGPRVKAGAVESTLEDLAWLGFDWDGEPILQSRRLARFELALDHLRAKGFIYPCVCTRSEVARAQSAPHEKAGGEPPYPGTCRGRYRDAAEARAATGREPAWRFRLPADARVRFADRFRGEVEIDLARAGGDFVVAKRSGQPAYQLAVVVDDADQEVSEVLRADDLLPSAARQLLLYEALGLEAPAFAHVPLVVGPDGRRLAKRHGDSRIARYRADGIAPERIVGFLAWSAGLLERPEARRPQDLIEDFALAKVPARPFVFDGRLAD